MTTHVQARAFARKALESILGASSTGAERALAGVACLETSYGDGWKGAGKGSFNMGAIQAGSWAGDTFAYTDTHPNADGTSTPYRIAFRKYPSPAAGWEDLVRVVFVNRGRTVVLAAAQKGDLLGVSQGLHRTGYYEGFGKTVADRIANHHAALARAVRAADLACQETTITVPAPVAHDAAPTLRRGSGYADGEREAVRHLQQHLQLAADGRFGPVTESTVIAYQRSRGLVADGIVGRLTWARLELDAAA